MAYNTPGEVLTDIANSIRTLHSSSSPIAYVDLPGLIKGAIPEDGIDLSNYNGTNWILAFIDHIDFDEMGSMNGLFSAINRGTSNPAQSLTLKDIQVYDKCDCYGMFFQSRLADVNLSGWEFIPTPYQSTSSLTFNNMFGSANILSLDFTGWDTNIVTSMKDMFLSATVTKMWVPSTFVATAVTGDSNKPFKTGNLVIYTDATDAQTQGWGTIGSNVVIHYNSTYQDFINA